MTVLIAPPEQWKPATPQFTSLEGQRSPAALQAVIRQFGVKVNKRYQPISTPKPETFCKTFAEDVALAMGITFPHWVDSAVDGNPAAVGKGVELNINAGIDWLNTHGCVRYGWKPALESDAIAATIRGELALIVEKTKVGHGHVAIGSPPQPGENPGYFWIAQAGMSCFEHAPISKGFGNIKPIYFTHP